ncbi:aldo/keto reductase [Plantibacter sp. YIM 135347]|uniref:aldo/keto reductase n=1 Tax=Plantibacter sp. YIM 135347 TaxID=3423919 RepID=UPI003D32ACA3
MPHLWRSSGGNKAQTLAAPVDAFPGDEQSASETTPEPAVQPTKPAVQPTKPARRTLLPSPRVQSTIARPAEPSMPHPSAPIPTQGPGLGAAVRRQIGDSELSVFPVVLGGAVFGWTVDPDSTTDILDRFHDYGGNMVDTADSYAGGRSEILIGNWMRARRNRDEMIVATKVGRHPDYQGLGPVSIVRAVEAALERLQTDHIDLLSFHEDDPSVPLADSLGTVDWLIETGKVRYLGASNYSAERLIEARILSASGYTKFVALETHYSLMHREAYEGGLSMVTTAQNVGVLPYFTLAGGFLTGKYRTRADLERTTRGARVASHFHRRGLRVLHVLDEIAGENHCSLASVALAWAMTKPGIVAPIASASRPEHVDALVAAAGLRLSRGQILELDRVSDRLK